MAVDFGDNYESERDRDARRKRDDRKAAKLVTIPACANKRRRKRLEKDDVAWLMWYFAPASGCESPFTYEFTLQQQEMIKAIRDAILGGDDQALAASRGEGKTTLFERMLLKYTLQGLIKFSVLFAATGSAADDSLESIKVEIENNERLNEDYPEVCVPVRALENTPNRAHYQLVAGNRHDNRKPFRNVSSKFSWCGKEIYFPRVPGSPSSGAIIATRGLDSAVRGLKKKGLRPQVAGIDDPDTEETARSEEQAIKLETRIDRAIAGLGSQTRRVARIMLTTLQNRRCASWKFVNSEMKPNWHGKRFRFLVTPPDRMDLWDEYVQLKKQDWEQGTNAAHEFYVANRDSMDAGAEVANPNRYAQGELSALQFYFNEVARIGPEAVATEYDNDPPEEEAATTSGITAHKVARCLSGYPRGIVPPECTMLTQGVDVKKDALHWVIKAWRADATNFVIDYGITDVTGTTYASDEGVERAIYRAVIRRMEELRSTAYETADKKPFQVGLTLVDSGWQAQSVYHACLEIGLGIYPSKGYGRSEGCAAVSFSPAKKETDTTKMGDGWRMDFQPIRAGKGVWLVGCDTDRWKAFEHARWLTAEGKPGAAYLFGGLTEEEQWQDSRRVPRQVRDHDTFAKHITSEIEVEEVVRGVLKRIWQKKTGRANNHYLDACYLSDVAASMLGTRLLTIRNHQQSSRPAVISSGRQRQSRW